ncbi:MAG: MerR family transcriptional regulator [Anaerolineae bacterium]|nr:MerR family transcriptional regulator [Anaerolineae bacterium]
MYTTQDLTRKYGVSRQTIANWSDLFERFLSPMANPPRGSQRRFTEADIRVFELVYEAKDRGLRTEEIIAALEAGQRGDTPEEIEFLPAVPASGTMVAMQQRILDLEEAISQLRTERDKTAGQNELLKQQLQAAQAEILRLSVEMSKLQS